MEERNSPALRPLLALGVFCLLNPGVSSYCVPRDYGLGSVVCVDTPSHCDLPGPLPSVGGDRLLVVTSDKAGQRYNQTYYSWTTVNYDSTSVAGIPGASGADSAASGADSAASGADSAASGADSAASGANSAASETESAGPGAADPRRTRTSNAEVILSVDRTKRYQKIEGFGGAFTDAAALNILSLPSQLQDCIVRSYFSTDGIQYTMGRVPIGGSDFSVRAYTYDDLNEGRTDENLAKFALQREDLRLKLPLIAAAERARNSTQPLKLVGSAWSAPVWMKTGPRLDGKGKLQRRYWAVWAQYIARFLKEYEKRGVKFWAVTAQNEPTDGLITDFPINAMGWTALEQAEWVGQSLGPTLAAEGFADTKIFVLDDNRIALPHWIDVMAAVNNTLAYVSGVAVHWYIDFLVPPSVLDRTHEMYPHLPILYTEACTGQWPWQPLKVVLGSWQRAIYYLDDIIDTLNHWSVGWIDWNLALDTKGGPNWAKNFVDAPIIVNAPVREVYKQPLFYAIGHVSKFVPEQSVRLGVKATNWPTTMRVVAFDRPDNCTSVIIINKKRSPVSLEVRDRGRSSGVVQLSASSFTSFLWC